MRHSKVLIEQFPAPTTPTAVMVFLGVVIFAATAAMFWLSGPRQNPTEVPPSAAEQPAATVVDTVSAASAGDTLEGAAAEPTVGPDMRPATPPLKGVALPAENPAEAIQPPLPSADDIAAVLATPEPGTFASSVEVAETTEELLALEEAQRREVEADLAGTSDETTAAIQPDSGPKVGAKATTWVNLRGGPSDDAEVLLVVPGNAAIEAETGCNWCAVSYDGRDGYIYKNFINYD